MSSPSPNDHNPYASPRAELAGGAAAFPQARFSFVAVIAGAAADIVSSMVLGVAFGIVRVLAMAQPGINAREAQELFTTPAMMWAQSAIGLLGTVIGGYVAAWIAKFWPVRHALMAGAVSLAWGIVALLVLHSPFPMWFSLLTSSLVLPAAMFGGCVRAKQTARRRLAQ